MYHIGELNDLEEALKASPENGYLRLMIIRKLKVYPEYNDQFLNHINVFLSQDPEHAEVKELLAESYLQKGNISTAIVILDELNSKNKLTGNGMLSLAKAYYKEGNTEVARSVYEQCLNQYPYITDDELDEAFRMKASFDEAVPDDDFLEKPDISFKDVGGLLSVKKEIDLKIIKPLEHAELYAQYGKKIGGGILLYGPPGCGKTYLAKATAGEIKANFINVGLNDILDMWHGNSEKNLHAIFEKARSNTPCVLFIDEIDALGAKRTDMRNSAGKTVINQFLSELDGIQSSNEGILIVGATNSPWHLDVAFRRPGRFDRIIFVPPPDVEGKVEILKIMLNEKPVGNIDHKKVASKTKGYSGADLNAMIDIAIEGKLTKAMETGVPEPIATSDLLAAIKKHKPSTIDWFTTAKNYALFANQSGLYDDILKYLDKK